MKCKYHKFEKLSRHKLTKSFLEGILQQVSGEKGDAEHADQICCIELPVF